MTEFNGEVYTTQSVCPECGRVVDAVLYEDNGQIFMKKTCPEHGEFIERLYDAGEFHRIEKYIREVDGFRPDLKLTDHFHLCEACPYYKTPPVLAIMDVTNRCNLHCSYCFANADASGYLYEPSFETIVEMLKALRTNYDLPVPSVMFSGGEPTIRDDFVDIVREAKKLNFFVLVATNGYKIAASKEYAKQLKDAGLSIVYLSFDGLTDKSNREKKNHLIIDRILENCRAAKLGIVLVPTAIRGLNDDEVYDIVKFGLENVDIIRGVNFQPISFCGRMSPEDRANQRYTITDLLEDLEKQSNGVIRKKDFYPVPTVLPITRFVEAFTGKREVAFSVHPMCGSATYIFKDSEGNYIPVTRFVDIDKLMALLDEYAEKVKKSSPMLKKVHLLALLKDLMSVIDKEKAPKEISPYELIKQIILQKGDMKALNMFHERCLFVGTMHFQDLYNTDTDRLMHCAIHYITPDMKTVSFCVYNSLGIREMIEKKYRRPWKGSNKTDVPGSPDDKTVSKP